MTTSQKDLQPTSSSDKILAEPRSNSFWDEAKKTEKQQLQDPLAAAFHSLFMNIATTVQSQLQCNTDSLELLERMNLRTASEYGELGDFAEGLRVFVERLKLKNDSLQEYVEKIDAIQQELTELEDIVSILNKHVCALESKLRKAYVEGTMD